MTFCLYMYKTDKFNCLSWTKSVIISRPISSYMYFVVVYVITTVLATNECKKLF